MRGGGRIDGQILRGLRRPATRVSGGFRFRQRGSDWAAPHAVRGLLGGLDP
jgi:hypothetical protein